MLCLFVIIVYVLVNECHEKTAEPHGWAAQRKIKMKSKFKTVRYVKLLPWQDSNLRPSGTDVKQPIVMLYQLSYTACHIYLSEVRLMQVPNPA